MKVEEAHFELGEKNTEILDSINYAKRIQEAILPSAEVVGKLLTNSFIYYKPKDIIAGDFSFACLNKSRTLEAPTPTNISTKSEPERE